VDPKAGLLEMSSPYVYALNSPVNFIDKDGELPIFINGLTANDTERGRPRYWNTQLLQTIGNSGLPNPGGTTFFVDGNIGSIGISRDGSLQNYSYSNTMAIGAPSREIAGKLAANEDWDKILSQLERDPKTGKIQIYTHSRGGAFGAGYANALLQLIKENSDQFADANHVIDFMLNMAPHQSDEIIASKGVDSYSIDHDWDMLSGNDMGNNVSFRTNTAWGNLGLSHKNMTFNREVGVFLKAFQKSKGDDKKLINDFVKQMQGYGIKVIVN
jgi:hypothetical protein